MGYVSAVWEVILTNNFKPNLAEKYGRLWGATMPTCVSNVSCIYHTLLIDVSKFDVIQSNNQVCMLRQKTWFFFWLYGKKCSDE